MCAPPNIWHSATAARVSRPVAHRLMMNINGRRGDFHRETGAGPIHSVNEGRSEMALPGRKKLAFTHHFLLSTENIGQRDLKGTLSYSRTHLLSLYFRSRRTSPSWTRWLKPFPVQLGIWVFFSYFLFKLNRILRKLRTLVSSSNGSENERFVFVL